MEPLIGCSDDADQGCSYSRLEWGGCVSKLTHRAGGQPLVLPGYQRCQFPATWVLSTGQSQQVEYHRNHSLLITEIILDHHCYILFIRSESLNPVHTQEEGITQRLEHQEEGSLSGYLKGYPSDPLTQQVWDGTQTSVITALLVIQTHTKV